MVNRRLVRRQDALKKTVGDATICEYFGQDVPTLGLATATLSGTFPPTSDAAWTVNETVDEMYFVLEGTGTIVYSDGESVDLEPGAAAHMPRGIRYRVTAARELRIVVATGPAWSAQQNKWVTD